VEEIGHEDDYSTVMLRPNLFKRVSMQDVARVAGGFKNTISLVLRKSPELPAGTRKRIAALAAKWINLTNPEVP